MPPTRVAAIVSHPIQYQAPLFRRLAGMSGLELEVFFEHDHGVRASLDPDFGQSIRFDVPLTEGFAHHFLTEGRGFARTTAMLVGGIAKLTSRLRHQAFDWVWVHGYSDAATLAAVASARALGISVLLRGESTLLYPLAPPKQAAKKVALRALLGQCDAFAYVGEQNRRFYRAYGATPEQLYFAPYSIDNERFAANAARAVACGKTTEIRERFRISRTDRLCIFVGKLIPRKRPLDLVFAIASLPPNYCVLFLGDGPLRCEVEAELVRLNVRGHVLGFVNQSSLADYYAAADMLAIPSEQETWGLVANEVMSCGKPVVASDKVGSSYDLLTPSSTKMPTGIMYPCGNISALANSLQLVSAAISANPAAVREAVCAKIAAYDISATAHGLMSAFLSKPRDRRS